MALTLVLDSISELPDDVQKEYTKKEEDGKFYLDTVSAGGLSVDTAQEFKEALAEATRKHETATANLKAFDDLDPTVARAAIKKVDEMKSWTPEEKVAEKLKANEAALEEKWSGEVSDLNTKNDALMGQVRDHTIDRVALEAINASKGNAALLMPLIRQNTAVEQDDKGIWVARVMKDGTPRITPVTGKTHKMTVAEFVDELRGDETYKACFAGAGAQGGGAENERAGDSTPVGKGGTVKASDATAMSANLEAIAKGDVTVVPG